MFKMNYNPDVLSCLANLSSDEVFTPPELVNQMLDMLPVELFRDPTTTFLDPACKSGVFLREITKRLMDGLADHIPDQQARVNHVLTKQVFGIAPTELTGFMSRRSVYCSKIANSTYSICDAFTTPQGNIIYQRTTHTWVNGRCSECGANKAEYDRNNELESYAYQFIHHPDPSQLFATEEHPRMKFDVIIGNPPYQLSDGGAQASAIPIYHKFVEQAKKLKPRYLSMIIPSRWFAGGKGLDDFRYEMLSDTRIRILKDFHDASVCFPGVDIKGGVCYFLWNSQERGTCEVTSYMSDGSTSTLKRYLQDKRSGNFIRYNGAIEIIEKIRSLGEPTMDNLVSSRKPFNFPTDFSEFVDEPAEGTVTIYAKNKTGKIKKSSITKNIDWVYKHKVLIPYAIGSGDSKSDILKPIYSSPGTCCTETYLVIGPFDKSEHAFNLIRYMKTQFFHFTLTLIKNTQHCTSKTYSLVPVQDFNIKWDDNLLFEKYKFTQQEIEFIKQMVPSMEKIND